MPKGIMVVQSAPSDPAREEEYNQWYSGSHIPEVLAVPGIVSARRYKPTGAGGDYLAVYDLDAEDLSALAGEAAARSESGEIHISDVLRLDPPPVITFYELIE